MNREHNLNVSPIFSTPDTLCRVIKYRLNEEMEPLKEQFPEGLKIGKEEKVEVELKDGQDTRCRHCQAFSSFEPIWPPTYSEPRSATLTLCVFCKSVTMRDGCYL